MDYKEKYEMALGTIQEILNSGFDSIKMSRLKLRLQSVFPELKKSKDEKIRKALIDFFSISAKRGGGIKHLVLMIETFLLGLRNRKK